MQESSDSSLLSNRLDGDVQEPVITSAPLPDAAHPNRLRWQRSAERAVLRGELVCDLLAETLPLRGARVLDAGCGNGGTSIALSRLGAYVTALDRNPDRLQILQDSCPDVETRLGDVNALSFPDSSFDAAVLQDVIEHTADPAAVLAEIARVLRPGGMLYLSTPNRDALPNIIADPHFGLPFVSRKNRATLRQILRRRRPSDAERDDLAELLSEMQLLRLLADAGLTSHFVNRTVAKRLFESPEAVVWSDLHLNAVRWIRRLHLHRAVLHVVRDEAGVINRLLNPTFYLICRKEGR